MGSQDSTIIGTKRETIGAGERKRIVTGGSSTFIVEGNSDIKTLAGNINLESAVEVKIIGSVVTITGGILNLKGQMITAPMGSAIPSLAPGPFCALPVCPLTGLPHSGSTFVSADPSIAMQVAASIVTPVPV